MKTRWALALTLLCATAAADEPRLDVKLDPVDVRKSFIEVPLKLVVSDSFPAADPEPAAAGVAADAENPAVEPGKVRWHKDFETAREAARQSGKPVLLFQLLGRLDQRFT